MVDLLPTNDHQVRRFDWDRVDDQVIVNMLGRGERIASDGSVSWTAVGIVLGSSAVTISVTEDTDEVIVELCDDCDQVFGGWKPIAALHNMIGRRIGWSWVACSSQGYLDSFSFSLDGIEPTHAFVAIASTLECMLFQKVKAT